MRYASQGRNSQAMPLPSLDASSNLPASHHRIVRSWARCLQGQCRGVVLGLLGGLICLATPHAAVLRVPQEYPTIQEGLTAASLGDIVLVAPGLYFESVVMKPGVHIHGEPGAILDGSQASGAIVSAWQGVERSAILSGFVIRRGQQAGILLNQASPTIRNNIIIDNAGAGIDCAQASPAVLNNILVTNGGGGIACRYPGTNPVITHNAWWGNQPTAYVRCLPGEGNLQEAPRFVNAQQGNYRLHADSVLIDAGDPQAIFNDADGSRSDLGIYGGPQPKAARPKSSLASTTEELFSAPKILRDGIALQGLPGMINTPTATTVPPGSLDVGFNTWRDPRVFPGVGRQKNFNFAVGLLPRVTIGGRGTVATDTDRGVDLAGDISANVQFLALDEGLWWPAVAVGLQDVGGGARNFRSSYVTLSKSAFGRVRGTLGVGFGPDVLNGPFGGVELALNRFVTLIGEYDSHQLNAGVRLFPLPETWETYGVPRTTVDLTWRQGQHFAWGVALRSTLGEGKFQAQRAQRAAQRYSRRIVPGQGERPLQRVSEELQSLLITQGFENVRVAVVVLAQGPTLVVEYENRRYNRDELDGLGVVMGWVALSSPASVTHMHIIIKEINLPVLQVVTNVDDFLAFVNEHISAHAFAQKVMVSQQVRSPLQDVQPEADTAVAHRSWWHVDVFVRPGIETAILTELGVADARFQLFPDVFFHLTPGTVVNVGADIPVVQTGGLLSEPLASPALDRLLLHQALRLPLGAWAREGAGLTQVSIGRFNREEVGIAHETALTFLEGQLFFKGTLARLGPSFTQLDRWVALANGRVRYPPWDMTVSVTGGLFLDRDRGVAVEVSRFFGTTEIGIFLRHTNHGSQAGLRLGIPLTLPKELAPWYIRPRLPDLFTYEQRTTVFTDRNIVRNDIGRVLNTGHDLERIYWNRDRLYPVYIRQHVDTLKDAVRRWIDEGSL